MEGVVACWPGVTVLWGLARLAGPGVKELLGLASWLAGLLPGDHNGQKRAAELPFNLINDEGRGYP